MNQNTLDNSTLNSMKTISLLLPLGLSALASFTPQHGYAASCGGNQVIVSILTDFAGAETTWQISDDSHMIIANGGPYTGQNFTQIHDTVCLGAVPVEACYAFKLMDTFGDGLHGMGKWQLRTITGKLLLTDQFFSSFTSPVAPAATPGYGSGHSFCLQPGLATIKASECGIFNNGLGNKVFCDLVPGATQYEFEFSDPDAGFARRIITSINYVHFGDMVNPGLTPGVKYFTRVRSNVAGPLASAHFGTGCQMGLSVPVVVRCSELISAPNYGHSCNETRAFGTSNSFIYAKPVTGADQYQFHIYIPSESYDTIITRSTYILQLSWNGNMPLVNGSTYNVDINVRVNGLYSGFCPGSCTITISNPPERPEARMAHATFGQATLWPNPISDGQVHLSIGDIQDLDQDITVDIQDIYGKQVFSKTFGNNGTRFTTIIDLPSNISSGIYMVNITVNGQTSEQRLSIIR